MNWVNTFIKYWLAIVLSFISVLGIVVSYFAGVDIAAQELRQLEILRFQVKPEEVQPFDRLSIRGDIIVQLGCGDSVNIEVGEHEDEVYFVQRRKNNLFITGQQIDEIKPFLIRITNPQQIVFLDLRNGAQLEMPSCTVDKSQLTANLYGGSKLAISGFTADLFLFASTGSEFVPGPEGDLIVEEVLVDMAFGATAELCGAFGRIGGSSSAKGKIYVSPEIPVLDVNPGYVHRDCASLEDKPNTV